LLNFFNFFKFFFLKFCFFSLKIDQYIHTKDFDRANHFIQNLQAGVVVVNAGTFGSEPHMPFGGIKQSGNGTREPGTEALDIYSNLKDIYINISPDVN